MGVTATRHEICVCGQYLDHAEREHCPRCGCQLRRAA